MNGTEVPRVFITLSHSSQRLEVEARLQKRTLAPLTCENNYKKKQHKRSANDHTRTDVKRLQVQALGSLSGRQEIRGLLPVVVFNQALLDWF